MIGLKVKVSSAALVYDKKHLRRVMRAAGGEVAAIARAMIRRGGGAPSAPGQPPSSRTGNLASSIKVRPFRSGEGVSIRDSAADAKGRPYSLFLETGAKGGGRGKGGKSGTSKRVGRSGRIAMTARLMAPRPYLSAALASRKNSIGDRIRAAVTEGIKFQRIKA